jgi:hypothetical protein
VLLGELNWGFLCYTAFDTVFVDDESYHDGHGHAYEHYGIDPHVGAVVIVRPDGYVSLLVGLEDTEIIGKPTKHI